MSLRDLRPVRSAPPDLTFVLLHHAGGSAASFVCFAPLLPPGWRLLAVDLPGRFYAPAGPRCHSIAEAVDYISAVLRPELTGPYAVFGHSLGGLLAYELTRHLESQGEGPSWLGVSGCPAPDNLATARAAARQEGLALVEFGAPDRYESRLRAALRDDLALIDSYEHVAGPPLRAPMSVFRGDSDPLTSPENMIAWAEQAGTSMAFHTLPGGHLFPFDHAADVCAQIVRDCRGSLKAYAVPSPIASR
jgi:surfactin synthase thioesterase subunit